MRKFTILAVLFALVAVVTGCKKDNANPSEPSQPVKEPMTFYAYPQGGERTGLDTDGNTSIWTEGDVIKIFSSSDTEGSPFTLTEGAGTNYGVFDGEIVKSSNYAAAYPADIASGQDGSIIIFDMQSSQNYAENTYAPNTVPVVSYTTTNQLEFVNTTGLLRLGVKTTESVTVTKMVLTDKNSTAKLWGKFKVTAASDNGLEYVEGGDNTLTINLGSGVELNSSTYTYFFFCLPAGTLAEGFTVDMETANGDVAKIDYTGTAKKTELNVGKPYDADGVEFVVLTTGEAEITGGTKVKWVQLWKDGPKWAEYNVGATSVGDYGGYYCWGMTIDKAPDTKYYDGEEDIQGGSHDTAKNLWGDNWQMATKQNFDALLAECDVEWKTNYNGTGKAGRVYKGKTEGYKENSVFFPAAGCYNYGEVDYAGSCGYYWSSTPNGSGYAYSLDFYSGDQYVSSSFRFDVQSVRAVLK